MLYTGVDLFTIAKVKEDNRSIYEAEKPVMLPVASVELPEEGSFTAVYKDGEAINAYATGTDQEIKINTTAIAPDLLNEILNGKEEPALIDTATAGTNYYSLGFRLSLYNGSYTYYSFLKGTISIDAKTIDTKQGTSAIVESITFKPLVTNHNFAYNNKPCRKLAVNTKKHNVDVEGWLAIQWTPDEFLPVPAPIIEIAGTSDGIEVAILSIRSTDTVRYTLDGTTPTLESKEYTEPIILNKATTIKAIECATSKHISAVAVKDINILAKPTISGEMGDGETAVVISSLDEGVCYRYATNGEEPTDASPLYGSMTLYKNDVIKAYAEKAGFIDSEIATAEIKVRLPKPILKRTATQASDNCSFSIENASDYGRYGSVSITFYQDGIKLLDTITTNIITVSSNKMITAVASIEGNEDSLISDIGYPNLRAQAPVIDLIDVSGTIKAKIYSRTLACNIYYTLDGTEPTEASTLYSEPIAYNGELIKARAYKNESLNPSDITTSASNALNYNGYYIGYGNYFIGY